MISGVHLNLVLRLPTSFSILRYTLRFSSPNPLDRPAITLLKTTRGRISPNQPNDISRPRLHSIVVTSPQHNFQTSFIDDTRCLSAPFGDSMATPNSFSGNRNILALLSGPTLHLRQTPVIYHRFPTCQPSQVSSPG